MIINTIKNIKRAPVRALAILLFAAVITMVICALQASNEAELRNYEEARQSVPVTVTVRGLQNGDRSYYPIQPWAPDLFLGEKTVKMVDASAAKDWEEAWKIKNNTEPTEISLAEYVKDIQMNF